MLVIRKQGLSDVSADDLWGSAEDPWHLHATKLKGVRVKGRHAARHWFHLAVTWWTALCAASWNVLQCRLSCWCLWGHCKVEVIHQSISRTLFVKNLLYKIIVAHSAVMFYTQKSMLKNMSLIKDSVKNVMINWEKKIMVKKRAFIFIIYSACIAFIRHTISVWIFFSPSCKILQKQYSWLHTLYGIRCSGRTLVSSG